jgi:ESF2/ABP1 family protein
LVIASAESASKPQYKKHQSANFTEAWLEFMDKRIAKTVAPMLNAQLIGGKKGDKWRDDIWTMRYLSGFRWEMLGEQVGTSAISVIDLAVNSLIDICRHHTAYERQAHQARLRQSLSQSKTEQTEYLKNVELARVLEKRRAKQSAQPDVNVDGGDKKRTKTTDDRVIHKTSSVPIKGEVGSDKARRTYKQREFAEDRASTGGSAGKSSGNTSNALQGVLNDLF